MSYVHCTSEWFRLVHEYRDIVDDVYLIGDFIPTVRHCTTLSLPYSTMLCKGVDMSVVCGLVPDLQRLPCYITLLHCTPRASLSGRVQD